MTTEQTPSADEGPIIQLKMWLKSPEKASKWTLSSKVLLVRPGAHYTTKCCSTSHIIRAAKLLNSILHCYSALTSGWGNDGSLYFTRLGLQEGWVWRNYSLPNRKPNAKWWHFLLRKRRGHVPCAPVGYASATNCLASRVSTAVQSQNTPSGPHTQQSGGKHSFLMKAVTLS